jgi:hypothetical protein
VRLVRAAASERHDISDLEFRRNQRLSVDEAYNRTQQQIQEHNERRRYCSAGRITSARQNADGGGPPQDCRSIETADVQASRKIAPAPNEPTRDTTCAATPRVLTCVVEARAKATQAKIDASQLTASVALKQSQEAQNQPSGALGRLLAAKTIPTSSRT